MMGLWMSFVAHWLRDRHRIAVEHEVLVRSFDPATPPVSLSVPGPRSRRFALRLPFVPERK
ncbi:MAG: hypothetical protein ACT4PT_12860 [Methanobacteriota archaeon]